MNMQLRQATINDFETVMELLRDGRNQLAERGGEQWQGDYPNKGHVKEDIEHGWAYLVQADGWPNSWCICNCWRSR